MGERVNGSTSCAAQIEFNCVVGDLGDHDSADGDADAAQEASDGFKSMSIAKEVVTDAINKLSRRAMKKCIDCGGRHCKEVYAGKSGVSLPWG